MRSPICTAGFPRSGTTWVSATLAAAPGVRTYHEPFNPQNVPRATAVDFHYATADHAEPSFDALVRDAFAGKVEGPYVEMRLRGPYRRFRHWPGRTHVKTVYAILALERIAALTNARVVVVRRDPLDVAASWHRLGWHPVPHIESLLAQPDLMADLLDPFEPVLRWRHDFWSGFGALWGATDLVLRRTIARNPDWIALRFTSLCADPVGKFEDLFRRLRLRWSLVRAQEIREASQTASTNPFQPTRVASEQVGKWRHEGFDSADLNRLRETLEPFEDAVPDVSTAFA
jgi:hypothetical protein